jgi:type IV secretory pathway VirB10-like protein
MKRCPQCEFIYEDDQGCCDMDGVKLVGDSQLLSDSRFAAIDVGSLVASTQASQWRSFALPAVGAAILGVVLFLVYYVSTHQTAPQNTHYSSAQVTVDSPSAAAQSVPNPELMQPAAAASRIDAEPTASPIESIQPDNAKRSSASSATPATKREEKKRKQDRAIRKSNSTDSKKDSKVGSFLKKAGNILKKPFKR